MEKTQGYRVGDRVDYHVNGAVLAGTITSDESKLHHRYEYIFTADGPLPYVAGVNAVDISLPSPEQQGG